MVREQVARMASLLCLLGLLATACRKAPPVDAGAGPFRLKTDSASRVANTPDETLAADFDGDGILDTLKLFDRAESPTAEGIPNRQIVVTITGRRGRFTVVDEVWAIEGRIGAALSISEPPPLFAIGVLNSEEKFWYRWDGAGYRIVGAQEPGFE